MEDSIIVVDIDQVWSLVEQGIANDRKDAVIDLLISVLKQAIEKIEKLEGSAG